MQDWGMKKRFEARKLSDRILHVRYARSTEMAHDFLRFQEFYESPKFKGKAFTRAEFNEWYRAKRGTKRSTYTTDWGGFNLPGWVFFGFASAMFDASRKSLEKQENKLWGTFLDAFERKDMEYIDGCCVIATAEDDVNEFDTFSHELAHAFFATDESYMDVVLSMLRTYECTELIKLYRFLRRQGYHKSVLNDEAHAHLIADGNYLNKQGIDVRALDQLRSDLLHFYSGRRVHLPAQAVA